MVLYDIKDSSRQSVLLYYREGTVRHYHIKKNAEDRFFLAEKHAFVTIPDLIYYHKHNAGGIATRLKNPPTKNKNAPVTAGFGHSM